MGEQRTGTARRPARERILDTAAELFYREGIRVVGIDTIIARSGVAKMSLYRNFASKDELVCAYLERNSVLHSQWWERVTTRHPGDPRAQLKALFQSLGHWLSHPKFQGCPFAAAAAELRDPANPAHALAVAHRQQVRMRLHALAAAAGADEPNRLAAHLHLLMEGAYAAGRTLESEPGSEPVASAAAILIDAACG
ncbi:TetR/AcrR family transcriptional regulator [Azospirillum picis]|uniref:AcrR family transcriptional regulator n=1 Tax=Azospirillum picis TaxID=488438 RepID=A0ABU0MFE0_9PROT|nr:TetR/AcrR family transcriptional regulator [Azospirillum picis]MBP2298796.1 AcrR family transcriptional regulator [Azospirillum picis]MDQ0532155.1 AcrR family transcriptional regulator [Azospirillum picis]